MKHNENSRVKIPALVHLTRLGYEYLSLKNYQGIIHPDTNIFVAIFRESISCINGKTLSDQDATALISELSIKLSNEDLGKAFYNILLNGINGIRLIDFENSSSLRESIEKTARLVNEERTILISPDNIYTPLIKENDTPEMALFKKAIAEKQIDIENYKPRFGSDYSNDLRALSGNSITFFKLKRMCDIFDINCMVTFEDKEGAPNPIGERLTICINNSQVPGQTKIESSDSKDEEDN